MPRSEVSAKTPAMVDPVTTDSLTRYCPQGAEVLKTSYLVLASLPREHQGSNMKNLDRNTYCSSFRGCSYVEAHFDGTFRLWRCTSEDLKVPALAFLFQNWVQYPVALLRNNNPILKLEIAGRRSREN